MTKTVKRPQEPKESYYQKRIMEWLKATYPHDGFFWKAQAGPYAKRGIPDICGVIDGHFFGFEVKRPGGKPTPIQAETIRRINAAGGVSCVVTTPEQARDAIFSTLPRHAGRGNE